MVKQNEKLEKIVKKTPQNKGTRITEERYLLNIKDRLLDISNQRIALINNLDELNYFRNSGKSIIKYYYKNGNMSYYVSEKEYGFTND